MSQLVLLGEQPFSSELATQVERLIGASGLVGLAKEGKLAALLEAAIFKNEAALIALNDDELSSILSLGFAVLGQLTVSSDASSLCQKFGSFLTSDPSTRPTFKIKTMTNLINIVGGLTTVTQAQRFQLLLQLLQFAVSAATTSNGASSSAALVLQPLETLSSLVDFWKLTPEQSLALYAASYKLASLPNVARKRDADIVIYNLGNQPTQQNEYLYALLKAVDVAGAVDPAVLREKTNQDLAVSAVVASVGNGLSSTIHQLDPTHVFPLQVVQTLAQSNSADATAAFGLIKAVVDGDLAAFSAWESKNGAFLKSYSAQLDQSTLLRKMRTLALCHLAVANQSAIQGTGADNILAYQRIRESLQLSAADDVEGVVIDAVMAGRIDGKMDQEAETLVIKRVTGGVPVSLYSGPNSAAAWSALGARLKTWRQNIHTVLTTLNLSQQIEHQDGAEEIQ